MAELFVRTDRERREEILARFAGLKILVVGDLMLDEFIWGKVSRISPEAPVPVVEVQSTSFFPGGAANVARNLKEFTDQVSVCGVVGQDRPAQELLTLLRHESIGVDGVIAIAGRPTTHKTRISAQLQQTARDPRGKSVNGSTGDLPLWSYAQMVRVDQESRQPIAIEDRQRLEDHLREVISQHDAIIIEDYAKGVLDQHLVSTIVAEARLHGKVTAVDPNPANPLQWEGVSVIKPNRSETFQAAGLASRPSLEAIQDAGRILQQRWSSRYLLITLGAEGMLLLEKGSDSGYLAPTQAREVYDVSGAGDTAIAMFTLALAAGATGVEAADLANHAAGVVVGKLGTATLGPDELRASFDSAGQAFNP